MSKIDEPVSPVPYGTVLSEQFRKKNSAKGSKNGYLVGTAGVFTTEGSNTSTNFFDKKKEAPQTPKPLKKSHRSRDDLTEMSKEQPHTPKPNMKYPTYTPKSKIPRASLTPPASPAAT